MAPAKAVRKLEPRTTTEMAGESMIRRSGATPAANPQRFPNGLAATEQSIPTVFPVDKVAPAVPLVRPRRDTNGYNFQPRTPVITGEATFRGTMPVDGVICGQLGANGSTLLIKQRPRTGPVESEPDLTGEINFKDMLRINGHVAGTVTSSKGTLIVDGSAQVDGDIDVGVVVVSGRVNGDVSGHERVELGPAAVITGNISTSSLTMKPGAVFQGDCRMIRNDDK